MTVLQSLDESDRRENRSFIIFMNLKPFQLIDNAAFCGVMLPVSLGIFKVFILFVEIVLKKCYFLISIVAVFYK